MVVGSGDRFEPDFARKCSGLDDWRELAETQLWGISRRTSDYGDGESRDSTTSTECELGVLIALMRFGFACHACPNSFNMTDCERPAKEGAKTRARC